MKRIIILATLTALLALPARAQSRLNLDFTELAEKASESVDVTLDGPMLRLGAKFLSDNDRDERNVRDIVQNLSAIYVRSYTFDDDHEYDPAIAARVRSQLGPTWKRFVTVKSKTQENVEVYMNVIGERSTGLVVIDAEPREFTVVEIVGAIDIDKLADLGGEFGIPRIEKNGKKGKP